MSESMNSDRSNELLSSSWSSQNSKKKLWRCPYIKIITYIWFRALHVKRMNPEMFHIIFSVQVHCQELPSVTCVYCRPEVGNFFETGSLSNNSNAYGWANVMLFKNKNNVLCIHVYTYCYFPLIWPTLFIDSSVLLLILTKRNNRYTVYYELRVRH